MIHAIVHHAFPTRLELLFAFDFVTPGPNEQLSSDCGNIDVHFSLLILFISCFVSYKAVLFCIQLQTAVNQSVVIFPHNMTVLNTGTKSWKD